MPSNKKLKYIKGKSKNNVGGKLSIKRSKKHNKNAIKKGGMNVEPAAGPGSQPAAVPEPGSQPTDSYPFGEVYDLGGE